jgi:excisionase family DNA binding protein
MTESFEESIFVSLQGGSVLPTGRPVTPIQHGKAEASVCTPPGAKDDPPPTIVAFFVLSAQKAETLISVLKEFMSSAEGLNPSSLATLPISSNEDSTTTWLTHLEAARFLGISKATLYRYAEQERIEFRKIGNRLEYRRSALDRFKEQHVHPVAASRSSGIIAPAPYSGK